jgi:hypothetical protein
LQGEHAVSKGKIHVGLALILVGGIAGAAQSQDVSTPEQLAMRRQILLMQTALETAVASGANDLARQLSSMTGVAPDTGLIGRPQAEGFRITGQTFFYVRVPGVSAVVLYSWPTLMRERPQAIAGGGAAGSRPVSGTGSGSAPPVSPVGVRPLDVAPDEPVAEFLKDPDAAYVRVIKANLVDTMLENSQPLRVPPDEFLTVAARKDERPNPFDPTSGRTMVFTIRGRDLEAYHQRRISIDEARQLVVISTY